eukprot:m.91931 g.91931  ORF g.91931 m.91931 type:complete len:51 (-) comp15056_c0_seq1:110-262(-)
MRTSRRATASNNHFFFSLTLKQTNQTNKQKQTNTSFHLCEKTTAPRLTGW